MMQLSDMLAHNGDGVTVKHTHRNLRGIHW